MTRKRVPVGRSHRTPLKHWMLSALLGKVVGVGGTGRVESFVNFRKYGLHCIDIGAGDGTVIEGKHTSSPYLMNWHCWNAMHPKHSSLIPYDAHITLIEKMEHTASVLAISVEGYEYKAPCEIIIRDARDYSIEPLSPYQPYFINADPNHINELPLARDFSERLTPASTYVVTLGCNVGGLKRLKPEEREPWFEYADMLCQRLPYWHDVILCSLENDASQWAYLARVPSKWSDGYMKAMRSKAKGFGFITNPVSLKGSREGFDRAIDTLFLTKKELVQNDQIG